MKSALSFALSALSYDQTKHRGRKHFCLHAVLVKLQNRRNTAKARWGLHRSKQQANANRNVQRGWKPRFLSKRGQPAQSPIYYLCRPRGNNWENKKLQRKPIFYKRVTLWKQANTPHVVMRTRWWKAMEKPRKQNSTVGWTLWKSS